MQTMPETNNLQSSYPPPFRRPGGERVHAEPGREQARVGDSASDTVPVVDLQCVDPGKIRDACTDWGLFRLVNHGVSSGVLSQLEEYAKTLFSLPFEDKQGLFNDSPISYFWGTPALTPSGTILSTKGPMDVNWVEGFNVPVAQLPQFVGQVPALASFGNLLEEYSEHLASISTTLFEAMAKELETVHIDNQDQSITSYVSKPSALIRVYRYPPCPNVDDALGMDVHTDSSVVSILSQDDVGGLQVFKDDELVNVKPVPNTLVVNLGDMMQAISDDVYKSVKHRVKVNKHVERISICYFIFPDEEFVIRSSKYRPFCYNDFRAQVQQDVKTVGAKVGLDRFKVNGPF